MVIKGRFVFQCAPDEVVRMNAGGAIALKLGFHGVAGKREPSFVEPLAAIPRPGPPQQVRSAFREFS
jgi:hypothetical protein